MFNHYRLVLYYNKNKDPVLMFRPSITGGLCVGVGVEGFGFGFTCFRGLPGLHKRLIGC